MLAVLRRRFTGDSFKDPVEMSQGLETNLKGNLADPVSGVQQKVLRLLVNHRRSSITSGGFGEGEVRFPFPEVLERALGLFPGRRFEERLARLEISDDFLADFHFHRCFIKAERASLRAEHATHHFAAALLRFETHRAAAVGLGQQGAAAVLVSSFNLGELLAFHGPQRQRQRRNHSKRLLELAEQRRLGHLFDHGRAWFCSHNST